MRIILLCFAIGLFGCTKTNPNVCCSDAADCSAAGIPSVQMCSEGLACLSHQCIAETCESSSECSAEAPYCASASGLCTETCSADSECPGADQSAIDAYCVGGGCVECRADVATDCGGTAPVCDEGSCRGCKDHGECASGVCGADGACVVASAIEYVSKTGTATSDCSVANPCNTIARALALHSNYIVVDVGTYQETSTFNVLDTRWIVGRGTPIITSTAKGPIFNVGANNMDLRFAHLQISGAKDDPSGNPGNAIYCPNNVSNSTIVLDDVSIVANSSTGLDSRTCHVTATRSRFNGNGFDGFATIASATVDRCEFSNNARDGLDFDGAVLNVSNVFAVRNVRDGIEYGSTSAGSSIDFCTAVDNGMVGIAAGQSNFDGHTLAVSNNLAVRNGVTGLECVPPSCLDSGSISMTGADLSALHFVSPDAQPYDYHLKAGSIAIDAATTSTMDHDFDGDARPKGAGRDVGADEAQ